MKIIKITVTVFIILLINLVLTGFLEVTIKRPIIYYEYAILPFVLLLANKHSYRTIILIGLILLDLVYNLSHLYYFDLFNYIEKIPYLFISNFNIQFWLILALSLFILVWFCNFLITLFEKNLEKLDKKYTINLFLSVSFLLLIYIIDTLNGSSLIGTLDNGKHIINITTKNKQEYNIGKSLLKDIYTDYTLFRLGKKEVHELADFKNINSDSSLSYKYFYNSTGNKEFIIVLESWGLYLNDTLLNNQIEPFYKIDTSRFKVKFEKSYFDGATVQAESRELLNKEGEAYFSVINHNKCDIKSLIKKKGEQNYKTLAVQPFLGTYSVGAKFKKLIGFETFKDYSFFHDTLGLPTVYNNQYTAVKDEDVFSWIFKNAANSAKTFTYCLTINTHLPFHLKQRIIKDPDYNKFYEKYNHSFPSTQTLKRYFRLTQELKYLADLINKSDVDRVLIIGDHAPPFLFKNERMLFSSTYVPALIIEKAPNFR